MRDVCMVMRTQGTSTDPDTGRSITMRLPVYQGRFKVATYEAFEQERESAGATKSINRVRCDFPVGTGPYLPGDVVRVDVSEDPQLVGTFLRLTTVGPQKSKATAYRVYAEILVGQEVPDW